jgi:FkbM family methyltransferase
MQSYSQFGQDKYLVTNVYPNKKDGYFVEVGAYDGVDMSNTYLLEHMGWKGICIEPNPRLYEKLVAVRQCACSPYAVFKEDDTEVEFMNDPTGGCSSIVETDVSSNRFAVIKVPTKKLTTILKEHGAPSYIEYLSIDTEGSEYQILKKHDFSLYRFGYICVEHNFNDANRRQIRELLESLGYKLQRSNHVDDEYIWSGLVSKKRGLFLNSTKGICSIHEVGLQCYDILSQSNDYQLEYSEEKGHVGGGQYYDFVVFNYHFVTNNWVTKDYLAKIAKTSFAIVTEIGLKEDIVLDTHSAPRIFDYYIALDPSIQERQGVLAFPRPLDLMPRVSNCLKGGEVIVGSFGLATFGKHWELIVEEVNKEFDIAKIRFNIPFATFVPDSEQRVEMIAGACKDRITKPGITLEITSNVMSRQELVDWCAENTINCFFYFRDHVCTGLAAVIDQAIASGRPLLVTKDKTFRHIHQYVPVYPDIGIRDAILHTQRGVLEMRNAWHRQTFLSKFEEFLRNLS